MSKARWHVPTVRMAWWMRPPPRRGLRDHERLALAAEQVLGGHAHVVVPDVRVRALALALSPPRPTLRMISMPGVSVGTRNIDVPWYTGTSGSVTAITIANVA